MSAFSRTPVSIVQRASALFWVALAMVSGACLAPQEEPESEQGSIALEELRELVRSGSLRSVEMPGGEVFDGLEQEYADELALNSADRALGADGGGSTPEAGEESGAGAGQESSVAGNLAEPEATVAAETPEPPPNPYLTFGERIIVHEDSGLISKPFPFPIGKAAQITGLLQDYGGFALHDVTAGPQPPDTVRLDLRPGLDVEAWSDPRTATFSSGTEVKVADWLIVTASFDLLVEVEDFINLFAARIPQIEIEAKIVEVTTSDSLDVGVKPLSDGTPIFQLPSPENSFVNGVDFDFGNVNEGTEALFSLGAVHDGLSFNAILEVLQYMENVTIVSSPKVAVREGGRAEMLNTKEIPFFNISGINTSGNYGATLTYKEVGIKLYVIPRIVGTDTVALNIDIEASQESGTAVSFTTGQATTVTNPVISKRSARTMVYLEPGQAVIIGGLVTERHLERENKIPILGDLPLLGALFRSNFTEKEETNVLFFIRPRILQTADLSREL
ncbi:MAG: hypothetical protein QF724_12295 [Planctomycetota bacterium]|jgi:type II secretory pathway component GspD/PulD (secretin)|nr:hypothetical protein [Planctomycetota bacterium]MDP6519161.1 hypothetical protein [Planctomycetota bacterium]MDP6839706.1 hypothetical protein [Planctomycetota bacterium]MDP6956005.1 hypothetical protein [Planctomycetota bacterium]